MCMCMCVYIYIYIYICVCVYIYIYICRRNESYRAVICNRTNSTDTLNTASAQHRDT